MTAATSLRARLTLIILLPLLLIALATGLWAYRDAQVRAAERFDRSLLSTALAISRDIGLSGGDALSETTRDLLNDTSGGDVFYHIYAPDGVFVTGYATPPVPPDGTINEVPNQTYFEAIYHGKPVRVLRFAEVMAIDGLTGDFTFTVWQNTELRDGFVNSLSRRTFGIIATLVIALGLIVWFGVRIGLRPLVDLEEAISRRSAADLSPIQRAIPAEVGGVVGRLNVLLGEMSNTFRAKDDFISNAAHQLRNPIAGVLSLSEAVEAAPTLEDARERSSDLVIAARQTADLANNLLALERAKSAPDRSVRQAIDVRDVIARLIPRMAAQCEERGVTFDATLCDAPACVRIDAVLFEQAILNLVVNALLHGGPALTEVHVSVALKGQEVEVVVADSGVGIDASEIATALERFGQVRPTAGSGLGLPIASSVVEGAGGTICLSNRAPGLAVTLTLPREG